MCCALSGTMKKAIEIATAHANNRTQFGNKLASYTGIQEKIARMSMLHYTTQSMAYMLRYFFLTFTLVANYFIIPVV